MSKLEESLNLTPPVHKAKEGRFIEVGNNIRMPESFPRFLKTFNQQLNINTINLGEVSGNHYHKFKQEGILIVNGKARVLIENPETKEKYETLADAGYHFTLVSGIAHAIMTATENPLILIEATNMGFDKDNEQKDIYLYKLI